MVELSVNPLNKLKLDIWFKVLIPIGAIILLLASYMSDKELMLLGFGLLLIGMGEWKNHRLHSKHIDASAYNAEQWIHATIRKPNALGILLDVLGIIALIIWGLGFFDIIHIV